MGKKVANAKLKVPGQNAKTKLSVFNTFANKLSTAHKKHSESLDNTKKRLMESKKTNSMLRLSKRSSRFALLDDNDNAPMLTHKGKPINELK